MKYKKLISAIVLVIFFRNLLNYECVIIKGNIKSENEIISALKIYNFQIQQILSKTNNHILIKLAEQSEIIEHKTKELIRVNKIFVTGIELVIKQYNNEKEKIKTRIENKNLCSNKDFLSIKFLNNNNEKHREEIYGKTKAIEIRVDKRSRVKRNMQDRIAHRNIKSTHRIRDGGIENILDKNKYVNKKPCVLENRIHGFFYVQGTQICVSYWRIMNVGGNHGCSLRETEVL